MQPDRIKAAVDAVRNFSEWVPSPLGPCGARPIRRGRVAEQIVEKVVSALTPHERDLRFLFHDGKWWRRVSGIITDSVDWEPGGQTTDPPAELVQEGQRAKRAEEALVLIHRNCVALANDDDPDVSAARRLALELDRDEDEDAEQASGKGRPVQAAGERAIAPDSGENLSVPAVRPVPATDPVRAAADLRARAEQMVGVIEKCRPKLAERVDNRTWILVNDAWDALRAALAAEREPVKITDEMVERLARYLYVESSPYVEDDRHWVMVGDGPYTDWKDEGRERARRLLSAALSKARTEDRP